MLDVLETARLFVDEVLARTVAIDAAGDRHLVIVGAELLLAVCEGDGHFRKPERLARVGAVEDHVDELGATQSRRLLLAEHPADRVGDVGFAAAVRTDNSNEARLECEAGLVGKALEADDVQLLEIH